MTTEIKAREIHSKVRVFFNLKDPYDPDRAKRTNEVGDLIRNPKSSNKGYSDGPKKDLRATNAAVSEKIMKGMQGDDWHQTSLDVRGEIISKMEDGKRSANCGEMVALAVFYAKQLSEPAVGLQLGLIDNDDVAEHAVCLVGASEKPASWSSMGKVTNADSNGGLWIVDGWANICCSPPMYAEAFRKKCGEWEAQNKLVKMAYSDLRVPDESYVRAILRNNMW